jgi:hypothetical protein
MRHPRPSFFATTTKKPKNESTESSRPNTNNPKAEFKRDLRDPISSPHTPTHVAQHRRRRAWRSSSSSSPYDDVDARGNRAARHRRCYIIFLAIKTESSDTSNIDDTAPPTSK